MTWPDLIKLLLFDNMDKEPDKRMPASRFWGLVVVFGGGWLLYAAAQLVDALGK